MADTSTIECGAFELIEQVGEGGMARVWRGRHRRQGIPVAFKVMGAEALADVEGVRVFRGEVQAHAGLDHPSIVEVFEHGRLSKPTAEAIGDLPPGSPYLVMEFADGGTLRERGLPSQWPVCRTILLRILDGLAHAHARQVIHRDIKPENIVCFPNEPEPSRFKLSDFGIAYAVDRIRRSGVDDVTMQDAGTPHYMAPEQVRGEWRRFGPWTDLYQVGALAYELVTGARPFDGKSVWDIAVQHLSEPVPTLEPQFAVPDRLESWIRRMMAKRPDQRFRRAADAARLLATMEAPPTSEPGPKIEASRQTLGEVSTDIEYVTTTLPTLAPVATRGTAEPEDSLANRLSITVSLPDSWELPPTDPDGPKLYDAGLGLFGLREVPFIDRDSEREALWQRFRTVVANDEPRAAVVRGRTGTGKTGLAQWIARRGHEFGAFTILRAFHDRYGGPASGLTGMVERWLKAWGLDRQSVLELARARLDPDEELAEADFRDLADVMRPSETVGDADVKTPQILGWLLRRIAERRPVIVLIDDAQWNAEALSFARHFLEGVDDSPVMFMVIFGTDEVDADSEVRETLDAFEALDRVESHEITSLETDDHLELVHQLLPLESDLVDAVCAWTEGHPLFAIQVVRDWVYRDLLQPGDDGYRLECDPAEVLPTDVGTLWIDRLQRALEVLPEERRKSALQTLELGAAFGRMVDSTEWRKACHRAGLTPPERTVENELVDSGLLQRRTTGWQFVHSMLVESLVERAREAGRWAEHNRICNETLGALYPEAHPEVATRRAHHRALAAER